MTTSEPMPNTPPASEDVVKRRTFLDQRTVKGRLDECWLWIGSRKPTTSRGIFRATMCHAGKTKNTARVIWELENGAIPEGQWVLHRCDNAMCVNPRHLYLGDMMQNIADRVRRRRSPTLLTPESAVKVLALKRQGLKPPEIAKVVKVHCTTVHSVLSGHTWSHVTGITPPANSRFRHISPNPQEPAK